MLLFFLNVIFISLVLELFLVLEELENLFFFSFLFLGKPNNFQFLCKPCHAAKGKLVKTLTSGPL